MKQFGIAPDTYVIGALGRLDPNKRIDLMIEAAVPVLGERCKILVIGRGEDQARVEAAVARLGVTDHVIFGGFQSDTAAMMAAFDLYVAASAQETFGLSVLEAMASGLPVLYTTCPALDGIQTSQARQVTGTAEALGAEIRKAVEAGPLPREADNAVFERYGMESVVQQNRRPLRAAPGPPSGQAAAGGGRELKGHARRERRGGQGGASGGRGR